MDLKYRYDIVLLVFKSFRVVIKFKLGKKINYVNFDRDGEYCGKYGKASWNLGLFSVFARTWY